MADALAAPTLGEDADATGAGELLLLSSDEGRFRERLHSGHFTGPSEAALSFSKHVACKWFPQHGNIVTPTELSWQITHSHGLSSSVPFQSGISERLDS